MNKYLGQVQGILAIGYIYLIILGILNEVLFYNQLGIDILSYSSIFDILISPIAKLTSKAAWFTIILLLIMMLVFLPSYLAKQKEKKWFKRGFKMEHLTGKQIEQALYRQIAAITVLFLVGLFVGSGFGRGERLKEKIQKKQLKYNDKLVFVSNERQDVEIIGKNSTFIFYLVRGNNNVMISPISGVVKRIEETK